MRLYNEIEENTKTIVVEDYSTFRGLLKSKVLFGLLIAYTAYAVINFVLALLDGGIIMGVVNLIVHGVVCAGLWLLNITNNKEEGEKFSIKGTKLIQIAHAVKYVVVFILLVLVLIFIIFSWIDAGNVAKQYLVAQKALINGDVEGAKHEQLMVAVKYIGLLVGYLVFCVVTCVYYKAVMALVDGVEKYHAKGKHCWNDLRFFAIYLFVAAGLVTLFGVLSAVGALDSVAKLISSSTDFTSFVGGLGYLSLIGRILFAGLCVAMGIVCLKGYKVLNETETSHEEVVEIEE